ncbi:MAG: VOC family protein [Pseudomonadota bacterium]
MSLPPLDGVLEAALYAEDLQAAAAFHGKTMGLPGILRLAGRHVFFQAGATVLLIFNPDATQLPSEDPALPVPTHGARGPGHLCFSASATAITQWRARLIAAGYPIEADFHWAEGTRSIYFRDPAGNSLEIAEPRLWAPSLDPRP